MKQISLLPLLSSNISKTGDITVFKLKCIKKKSEQLSWTLDPLLDKRLTCSQWSSE